jgi:cytoskeletal protein CcmA (bactofilin family)
MFGKNKNMKNVNTKSNEITTLIGEGRLFEGDIPSPSSTRVDGNIVGNIKGKGSLIIGNKGVVSGEVIVYGKVEGNVQSERMEIKKAEAFTGMYLLNSLL